MDRVSDVLVCCERYYPALQLSSKILVCNLMHRETRVKFLKLQGGICRVCFSQRSARLRVHKLNRVFALASKLPNASTPETLGGVLVTFTRIVDKPSNPRCLKTLIARWAASQISRTSPPKALATTDTCRGDPASTDCSVVGCSRGSSATAG